VSLRPIGLILKDGKLRPTGLTRTASTLEAFAGPPTQGETRMSSTTTGTAAGEPATEETSQLIASDKVEGTAVYNRNGDRLGSVYNFMVNKRSGQVAYAVLSFSVPD